MIELYDVNRDDVILSSVAVGQTTYEFALKSLYPLVDRFQEQRKLQRPKFYERLRKDLVAGCIMPPITLAFVDVTYASCSSPKDLSRFINQNISEGYILDGMQRLNTLKAASSEEGFDPMRPMLLNVIVAEKYDYLLYRMITLNNGQKPMTVRHQVEMLTNNLLSKFIDDRSLSNINFLSEKDTEKNSPKGSFKKADIASAYLAFLTGSPHNQNTRFIEEKLDEILVGKVMDSDLSSTTTSFSEVIKEIDRICANEEAKEWLKNDNNLIGFALGAKSSNLASKNVSPAQFGEATKTFEEAFQSINPSKVNVGKYRRDLSMFFISKIDETATFGVDDLVEEFFEITAT